MSETSTVSLSMSPIWTPPTVVRRKEAEMARIAALRKELLPEDFPLLQLAEHPLDVFTLQGRDRAPLLSGPKISVITDGNVVIRKNVPIRALIASSTKLHDLLLIKPKATQFRIYGTVDHKSVKSLLDMFTTKAGLKVRQVKLGSRDLVKDVLTYQACLALGIYYTHTKPLLNLLSAEITNRLLTREEMDTIISRVPATDPLFKHLANSLCHRRFKKEIDDIVSFERWLGNDRRKVLQNAMIEIDQQHRKRRAAVKTRQEAWGKARLAKTEGKAE
jgi:hypothetical protein